MENSYRNYCNDYNKTALNVQENAKFKKKYKKLKKLVKDTVFENAALCDQVAQMQENLVIVKEERLFLLRKLCQFQGRTDQTNSISTTNPLIVDENPTRRTAKKRSNASDDPNSKGKSKRAKIAKRVVQLIPLDANGRPIFPIALGDLMIYSLGDVINDRLTYHTPDLIYPVGFCSTRIYASTKNFQKKSLYTCKIVDGGSHPRFEIVSDNDFNQTLVGSTPDECHAKLLANISPQSVNIMPKGAYFFGISHPTVQNLIQSSPGTRKLAFYKQQRFEVCKNPQNNFSFIPEEELDPSINFDALNRVLMLNAYSIKEEPTEHDFQTLQNYI